MTLLLKLLFALFIFCYFLLNVCCSLLLRFQNNATVPNPGVFERLDEQKADFLFVLVVIVWLRFRIIVHDGLCVSGNMWTLEGNGASPGKHELLRKPVGKTI